MKTMRQIALLTLGIAAGIGAYSLLKYAPAISKTMAKSTGAEGGAQVVEVSLPLAETVRPSHHGHRHGRRGHHAHKGHPAQAAPVIAMAAPVITPPAPVAPPQVAPTPTFFKADGYVERANGELEAIIIQNDGIEILKLGDRIGPHLRVTVISRESVGAIDEASFQAPLNQPDKVDNAHSSDISGSLVAYSSSGPSVHRMAIPAAFHSF
jgi:hypothetical protein